jgi:hypothetical protein
LATKKRKKRDDRIPELDQKVMEALAARRHPEYDLMTAHWDFLAATYKGGREWFSTNIFQYMKEGPTEFDARVDRAYRFNHTREVVDLVNKYIFKAKVIRKEDAPPVIKDFWANSTLGGLSIDQFMWNVSLKTSQQGRCWIVVDNNAREAPRSRAEEKQLGIQTYVYMIGPEDVLDVSYDDNGAINWILIRETWRDDDNPFTSSGKVEKRFRLWTKDYWILIQEKTLSDGKTKKYSLVDSNWHDLGEVPVVRADNVESDEPYSSPALINDIAYLDRAVANYLSNLDAIVQDQSFSQLAIPVQNLMPGEEGYDKMLEMGTKRIFLYNGEGSGKPEFISPDPRQAALIVDVIGKIINEIYHTVGMAGERTKSDNSQGIDNSSGVAKAYDMERMGTLLANKARSLGRVENRILRLVNIWNGGSDDDVDLVTYPKDFDVRGLRDEFEVAGRLSLLEAPDALRRTQMRQLIEKLMPHLPEKERKEIESELKDWPPEAPEPTVGSPSLVERDVKPGETQEPVVEPGK